MLDVMQFMRQAVAAATAAGRVFSEDFAASEFAQAAGAAAAESARLAGDLLDKAVSRLLASGAVETVGEELQAGIAGVVRLRHAGDYLDLSQGPGFGSRGG